VITLERDPTQAIGIRPAVSAVIFDRRGRLLLQQRSDGGQWGLPGGSVEIGESVREAVAREVLEETGLTVAARRLVGVYSSPSLQTCDETLALEYFPLRRLPSTLLAYHRVRIRDASARRAAPFIR
jgi:8-oxo-dGTP pyrophosphatase MutT (NUDIX family)